MFRTPSLAVKNTPFKHWLNVSYPGPNAPGQVGRVKNEPLLYVVILHSDRLKKSTLHADSNHRSAPALRTCFVFRFRTPGTPWTPSHYIC